VFPVEDKRRRLKRLTKREMDVLFWQIRGLKDPDIAQKLGGIAVKTVGDRRTRMYAELGLDSIKDHEKPDMLVREYSRFAAEIVPDEEALKNYTPTREEVPPTPDPKLNTGQTSRPPVELRRNFVPFILIGLFALGVGLVTGGYLVYRFLPQSPAIVPPTQTNAVTIPSVLTQTIPQSPTLPLPTPVVPTIPPTDTPLPPTAFPTNTPKAYYAQGEAAVLRDNVFAQIADAFIGAGTSCNKPGMDFGVRIKISNNSSDEFVVRFNTSSFHATDDLNTQYSLYASSFFNQNSPLGIDLYGQLAGGQWVDICVAFKGKIPLQATYILVTADFISGVGPMTFRKDI
jgi:hypothetical protein